MKNAPLVSASVLFLILCLSGCNYSLPNTKAYYDNLTAARSTANEITSFYLQRLDGTEFVECKIDANTHAITANILSVDAAQLVSLSAIFFLTGGTVTVNGVPQVSGVTLNDFTRPVSYAVAAYDNTIRTYEVTLRILSPDDRELTFNLDSGSWTSGVTPPMYFKVTEPVTLPTALEVNKAGYTFGGWYEDAGYTGTAITGWSFGDKTSAVTLYAKWIKNLTLVISYGVETAQIDLVSNDSHTFTAIEKDAIQTLSLTATFDRGAPVVTRSNNLFAPTSENISITTGTLASIPVGYGKNTITLEFEGKTYTIVCYAALLAVEGTGSTLPASSFKEANTQAAVARIAAFVASADYTAMSPDQQTAFSPSVIAVAGTDTASAATNDSMVEITGATVPITLRGYGTGVNAGIIHNPSTANRRVLTIYDAAIVTMGANLTLTGGNSASGGGVFASGGAQFTMSGNAVISGNTAATNGGGVFASAAGTKFTMIENARIETNTASSGSSYGYGGGVHLSSGAQFTLGGDAVINGNIATIGGGGVYATGTGTQFTMNGAARIKANETTNSGFIGGGGVYVGSAAQFTLSGNAVISGNTAALNGGGVYVINSGTVFTMIDSARIETNGAQQGGGVHVTDSAQFTMSGTAAVISGNTATSDGGGVYLGASTTKLGGSVKVSGNKNIDSALNETNSNISVSTTSLQITASLTGGTGCIGVTPATGAPSGTVVAQGEGYTLAEPERAAIVSDAGGSFTLSGNTLIIP